MKFSKTLLQLLVAVAAMLPSLASAIGDSTGGCATYPSAWLAIAGGPDELDRALHAEAITKMDEVARQREWESTSWISKLRKQYPASGKRSFPGSLIDSTKLESISATICNAPDGTLLLDLAVAAGNLENVAYLLRLGADPSGLKGGGDTYPESILTRCLELSKSGVNPPTGSKYPEVNAERRLAAYAMLLQKGVDPNLRSRNGFGALTKCNDPVVVRFVLENGADLTKERKNPYEESVLTSVQDANTATATAAAAKARYLAARSSTRKVSEHVQRTICRSCSATGYEPQCRNLSQFVAVQNSRIFLQPKIRLDQSGIQMRCNALLMPDCIDCEWRAFFDKNGEPLPKPVGPPNG